MRWASEYERERVKEGEKIQFLDRSIYVGRWIVKVKSKRGENVGKKRSLQWQ